MTNIQSAESKIKTIVFIDETNLHKGCKKHNWKIDYRKFFEWFNNNYNVVDIYYHKGTLPFFQFCPHIIVENERKTKYEEYYNILSEEFEKIKKWGGSVITKIVDFIFDKERKCYNKKCNFDVEIAVIALDRINDYDEVIFCTGDGDFEYLIKYLKNKKKKITIISFSDMISRRLQNATKYHITIGSLRNIIKK